MSQAPFTALPLGHAALLLAVPAFAAVAAAGVAVRSSSVANSWRWARAASVAMVVAAVTGAVLRALTEDRAGAWLRSDTVGMTMLVLVSFVGWVVVRYSSTYLSGDRNERRSIARLLATLAAVSAVVIANDLVVLAVAWMATSLAMHGLLTFFRDRPVAVAVAHKKFLLARSADLCMLGAIAAFGATFRTLRIDAIVGDAVAAGPLPAGARFGIALVGLAAVLKCAQLPFHGWLIQVMEAPTPVSALLHAGVVNLGGFVLLRFAPVVDRAIETRALLVVVGSVTAVVAALVMTTRVSVKVALAWSTCAQMGFMLLQCGLGIWEMALLHLVAHSLYKAHAFLGAGGIVRETQRRQLAQTPRPPSVGSTAVAVLAAVAGTVAVGWAWGRLPFAEPLSATVWVLTGIVALAVVPLLTSSIAGTRVGRIPPGTALGALGIPIAYLGLHEIAARAVSHGSAAPVALLAVVVAAFTLLFLLQSACVVTPDAALVRRLYPWIYGGLFLDEAFTRVAFALWAPPAPQGGSSLLPRPPTRPLAAGTTSLPPVSGHPVTGPPVAAPPVAAPPVPIGPLA